MPLAVLTPRILCYTVLGGCIGWFVGLFLYSLSLRLAGFSPSPPRRRPARLSCKTSWEAGFDAERDLEKLLLSRLSPLGYGIVSNLLLPDRGRTTQIDFLVFHTTGIYVIEAKAHNARVFGHPWRPFWTALYHFRQPIRNPLHQNAIHMGALSDCTGISTLDCMTSIVAFSPRTRLSFFRPRNVMHFDHVVPYILSHPNRIGMHPRQMEIFFERIMAASKSIPRALEELHGTYDSEAMPPRCLRCGAKMVVRHRHRDHAPFWGCPHFPQCRGSRNYES